MNRRWFCYAVMIILAWGSLAACGGALEAEPTPPIFITTPTPPDMPLNPMFTARPSKTPSPTPSLTPSLSPTRDPAAQVPTFNLTPQPVVRSTNSPNAPPVVQLTRPPRSTPRPTRPPTVLDFGGIPEFTSGIIAPLPPVDLFAPQPQNPAPAENPPPTGPDLPPGLVPLPTLAP